MENYITLEVTRRLDNRFEGLADDSARALELHNFRKVALNEVFGGYMIYKIIIAIKKISPNTIRWLLYQKCPVL